MTDQPHGIDCPNCGHRLPQQGRYAAGLTRRMGQVLNVVAAREARGELSPTMEEIATATGLNPKSKGRVSTIINALAERGYLTRIAHRSRTIQLTAKAWAFYRAGNPDA